MKIIKVNSIMICILLFSSFGILSVSLAEQKNEYSAFEVFNPGLRLRYHVGLFQYVNSSGDIQFCPQVNMSQYQNYIQIEVKERYSNRAVLQIDTTIRGIIYETLNCTIYFYNFRCSVDNFENDFILPFFQQKVPKKNEQYIIQENENQIIKSEKSSSNFFDLNYGYVFGNNDKAIHYYELLEENNNQNYYRYERYSKILVTLSRSISSSTFPFFEIIGTPYLDFSGSWSLIDKNFDFHEYNNWNMSFVLVLILTGLFVCIEILLIYHQKKNNEEIFE